MIYNTYLIFIRWSWHKSPEALGISHAMRATEVGLLVLTEVTFGPYRGGGLVSRTSLVTKGWNFQSHPRHQGGERGWKWCNQPHLRNEAAIETPNRFVELLDW